MADKTIPQAGLRETLDGTEQLPVSYGGNPFRVFVSGIKDYIINTFFTNKAVTDDISDIGGELAYKNALVRGDVTSSFAGPIDAMPSIVNNGDGSVTLGTFDVDIFDNDAHRGRAKKYTVSGNTFTLTDNEPNYIVVNYNAGTPILVALTNGQYATINQSDILPVITISRTGNILHYFPNGFGTYGNGLPNRLLDDIAKTRRLTKEAGGINIVQRADRVVEITAGVGRLLIQPYAVDAFVSGQANNFLWDVYYNGTEWLYNSAATVWDNLQRNPTTGLVTLGNNQWGFIYVFRGIEEAKHAYFIRSQNEYGNAAAAKAAAFEFDARSYAPLWLTRHALPIAVIVFQKSATSGTAYQYNIVHGAIFGAAGLELSPAGATGDIQLNDGAGGLGVADAGVGKYEGSGAWTFGTRTTGGYVGIYSYTQGSNQYAADLCVVLGGENNQAQDTKSSVLGGSGNIASGFSSSVVAGSSCLSRSQYSLSSGLSALSDKYCESSRASGKFANTGDTELRTFTLFKLSSNGNPVLLALNGSSSYLILPAQISGWAFKIKVVGVKDDGSSAAFFFEGCIQRKSDASVNFVGTPLKTSYIDASLTGVDAAVIANNTDKRLDIQVTGLAATNIRWTAVVDVAQSVWGAW